MSLVLGIDPGLNRTGWGIVGYNNTKLSYVDCGVIVTDASTSLSERLNVLHVWLKDIIIKYEPDECAIEETFVNKNPLSSLKLGHARGALILTCSIFSLETYEYSATAVKKSITGVGRAEKGQIMMMIKQLLPKANVTNSDAADALAVAICHLHNVSLYPSRKGIKF